MFVTIGLGMMMNDKRFLHIDGKHFIFVSDSGMEKLAVVELFRYAIDVPTEVQMMQPLSRETLVHQQYVKMEVDDKYRYEDDERDRLSYLIKKAIKVAVKEKTAAFIHTDPNVRRFAAALKEIDVIAKEDNKKVELYLRSWHPPTGER